MSEVVDWHRCVGQGGLIFMYMSPCSLPYPFRLKKKKKPAVTGDAVSFADFLPRIMFYFVNRQFFCLVTSFGLLPLSHQGSPSRVQTHWKSLASSGHDIYLKSHYFHWTKTQILYAHDIMFNEITTWRYIWNLLTYLSCWLCYKYFV